MKPSILHWGLVAWLSAMGCSRGSHEHTSQPGLSGSATVPGVSEHGTPAHEADAAHSGNSDLDRPVSELFAAACEHGIKTYTCDECRYEVGVVRVPEALLKEGLVQVAVAGPRPAKAALSLTGEVRMNETTVVHVSARTAGIIRRVDVQPGQTVTRGTPLFEVDSTEAGEAQGEYLESRAELSLAEKRLARVGDLWDGGIASDKEFQGAQQDREIAEIRARVAKAKLGRLGAGVSAGSGQIAIRAPTSGQVIEMHAVVGETVEPQRSVMVLGDLSSLWVFADLYEADLARVLEQQLRGPVSAGVSVRAFPEREFRGAVGLVSSTMDRRSRTVKVRVDVDNPQGLLRPGMFATVRLYLAASGEVLAVPRTAVLQDEGRTFVFLHHEGEYYVRRPVVTGRTWDEWVEIVQGLASGDRVAADGSFLLKSDVLRSKMGAGCAD